MSSCQLRLFCKVDRCCRLWCHCVCSVMRPLLESLSLPVYWFFSCLFSFVNIFLCSLNLILNYCLFFLCSISVSKGIYKLTYVNCETFYIGRTNRIFTSWKIHLPQPDLNLESRGEHVIPRPTYLYNCFAILTLNESSERRIVEIDDRAWMWHACAWILKIRHVLTSFDISTVIVSACVTALLIRKSLDERNKEIYMRCFKRQALNIGCEHCNATGSMQSEWQMIVNTLGSFAQTTVSRFDRRH